MSNFLRIKLTPAGEKRAKMLYSPSKLTEAYRQVKEGGCSVRRAAEMYGVPRTTLRDRLSNRVSVDCTRTGPETVFTMEEEGRLCDHLKQLAEVGYGYTRSEVVNLASDFAVSLGKRPQEKPLTLHWFYNFMSRWPELKVVKPSSLTELRAKCANEKSICSYFAELSKIMTLYNLHDKPQNIYNIDEKGINTEYRPPHVVAGTECKAQAVMSERSKTITVIGGGNALGHQIPPFFVFPGARMLPELLQGRTPGTEGVMSTTGWSNSEIFAQYMQNHFLTYCQGRNVDEPILVLYDGHRSHVSLGLIEWAKENNIILFVLPPHTSHVLQPMDIGCFGPLQVKFNQESTRFARVNHRVVTRYDVCSLACKAYVTALSQQNLQASFKKAGIYPLLDGRTMCSNLGLKLKPSTLYESESCEQEVCVVNSGAADEGVPERVIEKSVQEQVIESVSENKCESTGVTVTNSDDFFGCRSAVVCKKVAKKRRNVSSVIGGKALVGETVTNLEQYMAQSASAKKSKHPSTDSKKAPTKNRKSIKKSRKSTTKPNSSTKSPQPGPSHVHLSDSEMSDSDTESNIAESEKCCVCKKFYASNVEGLEITNWVQCVICAHWVHLKYCTSLWVARKNTDFKCNCCI